MFIDTETTGIPQNWNAPYADNTNWPCSVQVAWAIYTREGKEVKAVNYYVRDEDFEISPVSLKIHGITQEFIQERGVQREEALLQLTADLQEYQPLVVAHFMQLDYHMVGVGYHRAGMPNPLLGLPLFCTMLASTDFLLRPHQRFLRLGEMYERLFGEPFENQHNALFDAKATARCFFELVRLGDINDALIDRQEAVPPRKDSFKNKTGCGLVFLLVFFITLFIRYWI
nr:3'-5' exonuclease [Pontibacter sp. E15-1]